MNEEYPRKAVECSVWNEGLISIVSEIKVKTMKKKKKWQDQMVSKVVEVKMSKDWRKSFIIPISKRKKDEQECENYRGIKLMIHSFHLGNYFRKDNKK